MGGGGGTDAAETVGRGCGNAGLTRNPATTGGEAAQQFKRQRMTGNTQTDRLLPASHCIRYPGLLFQNQGQRARPESFHQFPGKGRNLLRPAVDRVMATNMNNQRMVGRAAFGRKYFGDSRRIGGIRPQAIDRFSREGNQLAGPQKGDGAIEIRGHWRKGAARAIKPDPARSWRALSRSGRGGTG